MQVEVSCSHVVPVDNNQEDHEDGDQHHREAEEPCFGHPDT